MTLSDMHPPAPRMGEWRQPPRGSELVSRAFSALLAVFLLCTGSVVNAAGDSSVHFDIKAMPLADALMAFGAQSGLTVAAPTTLTAGKRSQTVRGELAPSNALDELLKGSDLTFARAADGTIAIQAISAGEAPSANTGPSSSPAESTVDQDQLGEIIVTAQRRSEELIKVAAPVTALLASDLTRQGDVKLSDYAASVPGLNLISPQPGNTTIIIRGVTTGYGFAISPTTATYIDDSPFGSATANAIGSLTSVDLDPATLQRIEVLRGPQGTLYGASAMGGLIKYVTVPPSLTKASGRVELDGSEAYGGDAGFGVRAEWNGPLVADTLGLAVNAYDRHDPGYIDNIHLNEKHVNSARVAGGRVALLWKPTDRFSAQLSALVQDTSTNGTSTIEVGANLAPIYGKYQQYRWGPERWDLHSALTSLRAVYDFGWASLTSITSYQTETAFISTDFSRRFGPLISSIIGVPNLGIFDNVSLDHHKITQEVRLVSRTGHPLEWLAGLFFTHEKSVQPEQFQNPFDLTTGAVVPVPGGIFTDPNMDSFKEYAGYADVTYHFTHQFKILAGVRVTHDVESNVTPFSGVFNGPPTVAIANIASQSTTYLFSPSYNFNDNNMVYVRVASGYRPGGPTGLTTTNVFQGAPAYYKPDSLTNYELGYKASLPDERMTIDLSGYDIEWKDIQVQSEVSGFIVTGNAAKARIAGSEFTWTWKPIDPLSLSFNAAYTNAFLTIDAPGIGARAGDRLPDVPKFSANLAANYDFPITADIEGFVGGNYQYMGSRVMDFEAGLPAGMARPTMGSYQIVNLSAGLTRGNLTAELHVKNVGNEYGFNQLFSEIIDGYSAPMAASVIQPRTFGLSVIYKF